MKKDKLRKRGIASDAEDFEVTLLNLHYLGLAGGEGLHEFNGVRGIIRLIPREMPVTV